MRELDIAALTGHDRGGAGRLADVVCRAVALRRPPRTGATSTGPFPGDPDGSFTDVLAHHVFSEFVAGADLLIDLHGGDLVEALEPFALYDDSPVRDTAERLARAYGLSYVVCDTTDALGGTTSAAAAAAGIPGVTAEAGGRGLLEPAEVRAPPARSAQLAARRRGAGRRARPARRRPAAGASASCGCAPRSAAGGSRRWTSATPSPRAIRWARCWTGSATSSRRSPPPSRGLVALLTSSPAVQADGLLAGLGAGLRPYDGPGNSSIP